MCSLQGSEFGLKGECTYSFTAPPIDYLTRGYDGHITSSIFDIVLISFPVFGVGFSEL